MTLSDLLVLPAKCVIFEFSGIISAPPAFDLTTTENKLSEGKELLAENSKKNVFGKSRFVTTVVGSLASLLLSATGSPHSAASDLTPVPVVVELFTSEGCSSCPPADELLPRLESLLDSRVQIITLSEHVDYWNYLGWRDPVSQNVFSTRQHKYAAALGQSAVYTPELVVDGITGFNGADSGAAVNAIRSRLSRGKHRLPIESCATLKDGGIQVDITIPYGSDRNSNSLVICLVEQELVVPVTRGENRGRTLRHHNVVQALKVIDNPPQSVKQVFAAVPTWHRGAMHAVAFLQNRRTLEITDAGTMSIR